MKNYLLNIKSIIWINKITNNLNSFSTWQVITIYIIFIVCVADSE